MSSNEIKETTHRRNWKNLLQCKERNKTSLHLLSVILHGLSSCRKGRLTTPTSPLTTPVARDFVNQTNIGWLKALMSLISQYLVNIQNQYLQSLAAINMGQRCIYALIIKLWKISWDMWMYKDNNLYSTYVPTKTDILNCIRAHITYHYNIVMNRVLQRCQLLLQKVIHPI